MIEEEKEFFIYEDYEDVDVDYSTRNIQKNPKETIVGVEEISSNPSKKGKEGVKEKKETRADKIVKPEEKKEVKEKPEKVKEKKKTAKKEEKKVAFVEKNAKPEEKKEVKEKPEKVKEPKEKKKKSNVLTIVLAIVAILLVILIILYIKGFFSGIMNKNAAAVVNNEVITIKELNENYDVIPESYKIFITKEQILEQMIEQRLLLQEANKKGIVVTDSEIDKAIADVLEQNLLTSSQFEEMVKERGLSMNEVRESYKKQLMIEELIEQEVNSKINVSEDKIREYYDGMIRASHILVGSKEEADKILIELKKGADFAEIAKNKSIDTASGARGGDLGEFAKGQMISEFEDAAFKLKEGELSGVVQTSYGYHIIKRTPKNLTYEEAKGRIKALLAAPEQEKLYADYVEGLRSKAKIVINLENETGAETETASVEEVSGEDINQVQNEIEEIKQELPKECFESYGATKDTVIFYYADWCLQQDQCSVSKEAIANLEKQGYKFQLATKGDSIITCFGINENFVPQFICAGTKEIVIGSQTEQSLKSFSDKCKRF